MNSVEESIMNETIRLFSEKGYSATSIRDIANAVNMKSASLYHYMENKSDLLDQVMERYLTQLIDGANHAIKHIQSPEDRLKHLIKLHVSSHGNERLAALVVDTEYRSLKGESKEKIKILRKKYENIWSDILQDGYKKDVFSFPDLKVTSYALINLCTGVAHWYRDEGRFSLDDIATQYAALGMHMVQFEGGE